MEGLPPHARTDGCCCWDDHHLFDLRRGLGRTCKHRPWRSEERKKDEEAEHGGDLGLGRTKPTQRPEPLLRPAKFMREIWAELWVASTFENLTRKIRSGVADVV